MILGDAEYDLNALAAAGADLADAIAETVRRELDDPGFHYSTLSRFRSRLMQLCQERHAFDKLVELATTAGFLKRDGEQVIDSTPIHGAVALQDT